MPCFSPIQGFRGKELTKLGKRKIVFNSNDAIDTGVLFQVKVPCGRCVGCRLQRSLQWAIRCSHESDLYSENCFITLTYDDKHLPKGNTLVMQDFQKFMKRLRKRFSGVDPVFDIFNDIITFPIRFFHCGEYGDKYKRPHYHACLFNFDFPDKVLWKVINGQKLYRSAALEELWPYGYSSVGSVTFESAAYVARYIMKKQVGDSSYLFYSDIDFDSGEILFERKKEYVTMSRRPGIGRKWIDKYMDDTYKDDFVVLAGGKKVRPPKYYDSQFEVMYPSDFDRLKYNRQVSSVKFKDNNTPERLAVRKKILLSKLKSLPRILDSEL